jgi:hypothetical protein
MTHDQRMDRIQTLSTELSRLLEQEYGPPTKVKVLTHDDLPCWLAEGLRAAVRRKIAEESPGVH